MELSLFSYRKGSSPMHRMNAGVKLVLYIVFSIAVFAGKNPETVQDVLTPGIIVRTLVCLLFSVVCFFASGARWKGLVQLRFVFVIGFLLTVFKMIGNPWNGLAYGVLYTLRFFITALAAQTVFETTSMLQIQEALHLPFVVGLAVNFIPQVFAQWQQIQCAVKARTSRGSRRGLVRKTALMFHALETLFSVMLVRAEEVRKAVANRRPHAD